MTPAPKRKRWVPKVGDRVNLHGTVRSVMPFEHFACVSIDDQGCAPICVELKHLHPLTKKKKLDLGPLFEAHSILRRDIPLRLSFEIEKLRKQWEDQ